MNKLIEAMVRPIDEDAKIVNEILRLTENTAAEWMGGNNPEDWEADPAAIEDVMRQVGQRFKSERTKGYTHPESGQYLEPVPAEQANARWAQAEPHFRQAMSRYNPEVQKRLRIWRRKQPAGGAGVCPHCGK